MTLVAAIAANPDDDDSYRVLADELQAAGDPRGELIALQLARESERMPIKARRIDEAIAHHFLTHGERLLGPLRAWTDDALFSPHWTWRRGFIDRFSTSTDRSNDTRALMETVFAHPASQLIQEITLHLDRDHQALVDLVERAPPSVRVLRILSSAKTGTPTVQKLWDRFPRLAEIELAHCEVGVAELPSVRTAGLSGKSVRATAGHWPLLEALTISLGYPPAYADEALAMMSNVQLPRLKRLALLHCSFVRELTAQLEASVVGAQLDELELRHSQVDDGDALAWPTPARRLKVLRVLDHRMSHVGIEALSRVADRVITRQKDDR